jgi:hypothetical protein
MTDWGKELRRWLDTTFCPKCGGHYDYHKFMLPEEIRERESEGCTVHICDVHISVSKGVLEWNEGVPRSRGHFVRVIEAPEKPCDEDYMEEIST